MSETPKTSLDSLPDAIQTIHKLQCGLNSQIQNYQRILKQEKDNLKEAQKHTDDIFQQLTAIDKQTISTENQRSIICEKNRQLETEIEHLIADQVKCDHDVTQMKIELDLDQNTLAKTREKMEDYRTCVRALGKDLDLSTQLGHMQLKVKALQQERDDLKMARSSNKEDVDLVAAESIEELVKEKTRIELAVGKVKDELMQILEEQEKIDKETNILLKKNRAQMLRMKRLVQEGRPSF